MVGVLTRQNFYHRKVSGEVLTLTYPGKSVTNKTSHISLLREQLTEDNKLSSGRVQTNLEQFHQQEACS